MVVVTDGRAQGEVAWDLKKKREVELAELKSCYLNSVLLHTGRGSGLDRPNTILVLVSQLTVHFFSEQHISIGTLLSVHSFHVSNVARIVPRHVRCDAACKERRRYESIA